ncbi:MAG: EAL domain-containing protein [Lachnospiraceae bacterium]|nr:EAL domain-containing protein [Lachnospiraceae bacterium]
MGNETVPLHRRKKLDSLFEAFSILAEDTYVYLCDMVYDYSRWSKTLVQEFGLPSEYMINAGSIWEEHIHPDDKQTYHEGIDAIFSQKAKGHDMQYRAKKANGEYDVCTCRGIVITDDNGRPEYFGGAIRNHAKQSHIDKLTGLSNQYGFFEGISRQIKTHTNSRTCIIGISRLTEINEVYGYRFGNRVLQLFGRYLMEHIGNRGGTYRLDGCKFAVSTETQSLKELEESYDSLRAHFRAGINVDGTFVALELNAGALSLEDFDTDVQTIYACLNFAYDESKTRKHGDFVPFHEELNLDKRGRIAMLHDIRNNISKGFDGFYLLYQPVVHAESEKLIGAEALLRWKNEKYGMVPPDLFIPILEKDPLFPDLGEWILRTAVQETKEILKVIPGFVINVNLSYTQLEQPNFTSRVWKVLKETDFPPDHLCLEVTERCRLLNMDLLEKVILNLRSGGIKIALDDFGTGFSSMGLVKALPFDTIKIDRGFVQKIEEDDKERKLVNNFVSIAKTFGAKVCVEGIETSGMCRILREYNIHSFQGYYYSKPIEIEKLLSNYT